MIKLAKLGGYVKIYNENELDNIIKQLIYIWKKITFLNLGYKKKKIIKIKTII